MKGNPINAEALPLDIVGPCTTDADCKQCAKRVVPFLADLMVRVNKAAEKKVKKQNANARRKEAKRLVAEAEEKEHRKLEKAALRKEKQAAWARENPDEAAAFAAKKQAEAAAAESAAGIPAGGSSDGAGGAVRSGDGRVESGYSHSVLRIGIMLLVLGNLAVLGSIKMGWITEDDVTFATAKVYSYIKI